MLYAWSILTLSCATSRLLDALTITCHLDMYSCHLRYPKKTLTCRAPWSISHWRMISCPACSTIRVNITATERGLRSLLVNLQDDDSIWKSREGFQSRFMVSSQPWKTAVSNLGKHSKDFIRIRPSWAGLASLGRTCWSPRSIPPAPVKRLATFMLFTTLRMVVKPSQLKTCFAAQMIFRKRAQLDGTRVPIGGAQSKRETNEFAFGNSSDPQLFKLIYRFLQYSKWLTNTLAITWATIQSASCWHREFSKLSHLADMQMLYTVYAKLAGQSK